MPDCFYWIPWTLDLIVIVIIIIITVIVLISNSWGKKIDWPRVLHYREKSRASKEESGKIRAVTRSVHDRRARAVSCPQSVAHLRVMQVIVELVTSFIVVSLLAYIHVCVCVCWHVSLTAYTRRCYSVGWVRILGLPIISCHQCRRSFHTCANNARG